MIETDLPLSLAEGRRQSWPRPVATPEESGATYFCRYFALADGANHRDWPLLNPRGPRLLGFNTLRGTTAPTPTSASSRRRTAPCGLAGRIGVDGSVRSHPSARRADIHPARAPDHRRHADGRADECRPHRRRWDVGLIAAGTPFVIPTPRSHTGSRSPFVHAQALARAAACAPERRGGLELPGRRSCPRRGALPVACTMLDRTAALDPSGAPGVRASRARRHERANLSHRDRQVDYGGTTRSDSRAATAREAWADDLETRLDVRRRGRPGTRRSGRRAGGDEERQHGYAAGCRKDAAADVLLRRQRVLSQFDRDPCRRQREVRADRLPQRPLPRPLGQGDRALHPDRQDDRRRQRRSRRRALVQRPAGTRRQPEGLRAGQARKDRRDERHQGDPERRADSPTGPSRWSCASRRPAYSDTSATSIPG